MTDHPKITAILSDLTGTAASAIAVTDDLRADLRLDSLDMLELAMEMEDQLGIELDEAAVVACRTVGDLVHLVGVQHG